MTVPNKAQNSTKMSENLHSVGLLQAYQPERLSRVDFTFDYFLPNLDFDEDSFVSVASKDSQHRRNHKIQTFSFD